MCELYSDIFFDSLDKQRNILNCNLTEKGELSVLKKCLGLKHELQMSVDTLYRRCKEFGIDVEVSKRLTDVPFMTHTGLSTSNPRCRYKVQYTGMGIILTQRLQSNTLI